VAPLRSLYILPFFILFSTALAQASSERDLLPQDQVHMDIVNQQMDQMEGTAYQKKPAQQVNSRPLINEIS